MRKKKEEKAAEEMDADDCDDRQLLIDCCFCSTETDVTIVDDWVKDETYKAVRTNERTNGRSRGCSVGRSVN